MAPGGFGTKNLSTNKHNVQDLRAAALATPFARDHDHMIGLVIQRAGFGAGFGFHGLFHRKFRRAVFLDDAQRAVAVRTKGLHGARIENGTVAAAGQRQGGDDLAVDRTQDDTSGRALAPSSAATHREKNVVLGIDGQARRPFAFFAEVEMAGHLEGFGVHHGDVVRVGHVKIEMSLAVRDALLDGGIGAVRADGLHLADDRTVLGVDHK